MGHKDKLFSYWLDYRWIVFSSLLILLYLLGVSLQGFDLTDEGYVLYSYQNIFKAPECVGYTFGTYLTGFVGGIWELLFGSGGWYSFRILNTIIIVGGYILICFLLKRYWEYKWLIFVSFFIVVMNMNVTHGALVFHYYSFSGFTNTLIGVLLYGGFEKRNKGLIFLSSVLLGVNVFVRIPNLTLCLIPYVLLVIVYYYDRNLQECKRYFIYSTTGIVIGVALIIGLIVVLRHDDLFVDQIYALEKTAQDTSNSHSIGALLQITFVQFTYILIYMIAFAIMFMGIFRLMRKINSPKLMRMIVPVSIFICVCLAYFVIPSVVQPMFHRMTFLLAVTYGMMIFVVYKCYQNKSIVYLVSIFFLISILQPLGSDWSIGNMGPYSVWGVIPVAFCLFAFSIKDEKLQPDVFYKSWLVAIMFVLLFSLGKNICKYCYRDEGDRFAKTYRIKASPLASVRTSVERGQELESLLIECKKYIREGDIVFFASDVPGLYYLTKTRALLGNPWPMVWTADRLRNKLQECLQNNRCIVVEHKPQMFNAAIEQHYLSNMKEVNQLLAEKDYSLVWNNKNYRIYK